MIVDMPQKNVSIRIEPLPKEFTLVRRTVWSRVLQLHVCTLNDAARQGLVDAVMREFYPRATYTADYPAALRWFSHPFYGFVRAPFKLYRRLRSQSDPFALGFKIIDPVANPQGVKVVGVAEVSWGNTPLFDVVFRVTPGVGQSVKVTAFDDRGEMIPGQYVVMNASGWGRIRTTGIGQIMAYGTGTINEMWGISQYDMVNHPSWGDPIQIVGMPFEQGALPYYDNQLQGPVPASMSGIDAARLRLQIASMLQLPCPAIAGVPNSPVWVQPDPTAFLNQFLKGRDYQGNSFFEAVTECLSSTNDFVSSMAQRNFILEKKLEGIRQLYHPQDTGTNPTLMKMPVVAVSMLNVCTDGFAACALGYGTTDLPPKAQIQSGGLVAFPASFTAPSGANYTYPYDYMIVGNYQGIWTFEGQVTTWKQELAAIAELRPGPWPATSLEVSLHTKDRPLDRDKQFMETRQLKWAIPQLPQSYGIVAERPSEAPQFLNPQRMGDKGYQPFTPGRPKAVDGDYPVDEKSSYFDKTGLEPFSGQAQTKYYVIGTDVFGRWSNWASTAYTSSARSVQTPMIEKVLFVPQSETGSKQTGKLVIDFVWEWIDRKPKKIVFYGAFCNINAIPGQHPVNFKLSSNQQISLIIEFDINEAPVMIPSGYGKVEQVALTAQPAGMPVPKGSDLRKYRLEVFNMEFDFASVGKLGYAVFARGYEAVRPNTSSAPVGPRVVYVSDPRPPELECEVPQITWTALPDATGTARGRISWQAAANCTGYAVWYTTETQLVAKFPLNVPPANYTLNERAEHWKDFINNPVNQNTVSEVFTRIAEVKNVIEYEVEISRGSDVLHFYRISAKGVNAKESARSDAFAVAVPKRIKPGQPAMILRKVDTDSQKGIVVKVVPGPVPNPDGAKVFRARREGLAREIGTMGPAAFSGYSADWTKEMVQLGNETVEAWTWVDEVDYSWFPFYYRAQTMGASDPGQLTNYQIQGHYPGFSDPTPPQEIYFTPPAPPALNLLDPQPEHYFYLKDWNVYRFTASLPSKLSPLGPAKLEVFRIKKEGLKMRRELEVSAQTHALFAQGALPGVAYVVVHYPKQFIFCRDQNMNFPAQYWIALEVIAEDEPDWLSARVLKVTDPLGRTCEVDLIVNPGNI